MDRNDSRPGDAPGSGQEANWLWILAATITANRDKLLVLEDEAGDYLPVFKAREEGAAFMSRLDPEGRLDYQAQAMHLLDLRVLANVKSYRLLTLDGQGRVLARWSPNPDGLA
jgi:predicted ATP-grasp superfamily ATP-dependent carboligase